MSKQVVFSVVTVVTLLLIAVIMINPSSVSSTIVNLLRGRVRIENSSTEILISSHDHMFNLINATVTNSTNKHSLRRLEEETIQKDKPKVISRLETLVKSKQVDGRIMATFTNYPYLDAFYVCYMSSKLWRYPNFIVVALDRKTYNVLSSQGFPVALLRVNNVEQCDNQKSSDYGQHCFNEIMRLKLVIIKKILSLGASCLLFDSDVVIFKNPFDGIPQPEVFDFVSQVDEHICAGFIYFKPTPRSFLVIDMSMKQMDGREINDQDAIQEVIGRNMVAGVIWSLLPSSTYSKGSIFFNDHQFPWTKISPEQIMAHNNYVIGSANKVYRLKEAGLYGFDVDKEYSNPNAFYITVEVFNQEPGQTNMMTQFVKIANGLNRHAVMPKMKCSGDLVFPCNLCGHQHFYCMRDPLSLVILPWKEHVFFNNQFVPDDVKLSYLTTPIAVFVKTPTECKEHLSNAIVSTRCVMYSSSKADHIVLMEMFNEFKDEKVIRIKEIPFDLILFLVCYRQHI